MRNQYRLVLIVIGVMLLLSSSLIAGDGWWDMKNCEMCKPFANDDLMEHVAYEVHNISNGLLMTSSVEEKYKEQFEKAGMEMQKVVNKLVAGEQVHLCNSCQAMNQMFMKGAKMDEVTTKTGHITIITADTPELVADIHAWADRTNVEMAKMEETHEGHEGHDHDHADH